MTTLSIGQLLEYWPHLLRREKRLMKVICVSHQKVYEVTPIGRPFSLGGDSGALVVTDQLGHEEKVVGIIIAGEKNKSILLPLKPALSELKLQLVARHNVK